MLGTALLWLSIAQSMRAIQFDGQIRTAKKKKKVETTTYCMNEWMDEWMDEWMNEWMDEWMDEWMNELMNGWMNEWMNEWMKF